MRFRAVMAYLIGVQLLLLTIGTLLRAGLQSQPSDANFLVSDEGLSKESGQKSLNPVTRSEPYIVPKIPVDPQVAAEEEKREEFNRLKWADIFSLAGNDTYGFWKGVIPLNYSMKPDFVIGIPTVGRNGESYLKGTLDSLLDNRNEFNNMVIVVYIGEEDVEVVARITADIQRNFSTEFSNGKIQVISPPNHYYPDWKVEMRQSFGDTFQRVKWRSKQNLDQVYLMMYSYSLQPKYYLMLEDDIIAAKDYLSKIYSDAEAKRDQNFVLITYCQLGAIGKLFRRELLPSLATYISLFWSDKPLDWLIADYMRTRVCGLDEDEKGCRQKINDIRIIYKPSLFQHIGTKSSFPGKIQKLKDKAFKPS